MNELNMKQKKFADLYLVDGNITNSYKKAYGVTDDNVAAVTGHQLLRNPKVALYIEKSRPKLEEEFNLTVDKLREEVWGLIKDVDTTVANKLKGYDILAKTLGAYTTNTNVRVQDDMPENIKQLSIEELRGLANLGKKVE